jgi:hypothetical protein
MSIIDELPFPFDKSEGQDLMRVMAALFPTYPEAILFTQPFGINPLAIQPNLTTINLWHDLLEKLARAGTVRDVVKAARDQFPNNPRANFLDGLLADHTVPALEPIDSKALVTDFNESLKKIADLKAHKAVRETVGRFRADFERTSEQIKILEQYKLLHNYLHELQMKLGAIEDVLGRLNREPRVRRNVGMYAIELRLVVRSARKAIPGLPTKDQEEDWVNELDEYAKEMDRVANSSSEAAGQISERLISLVSAESARINIRLVSVAYLLRLGSFVKTMDQIAEDMRSSSSPGAPATAKQLTTGSAAVNQLWKRIEGLVFEHNQWQDLHTQLDLLANSFQHQPQNLPKWSQFKQKLVSLCDRHAGEDWARELQAALSGWLAATSSSSPTEGDRIEISFGEFRSLCVSRFFDVDKQLNALCEQMIRVASPLDMLLTVMDSNGG